MVPAAASSSLREPAQTLRYPAAALCGCTDESPSAWIPSRLPLGTAARHWQSNFSAIPPNLRPRSALPLRSALPRWTTSTLPPPSPSRRAPGSTPYSATLPTDAPDPMGRSNNDPARHGRSTDEPHSNKSYSAHGYASGPIPSRRVEGPDGVITTRTAYVWRDGIVVTPSCPFNRAAYAYQCVLHHSVG